MHRSLLPATIGLLMWTCISLASQEPVDSSRVVRVLSFNIYHGETRGGDFDLEKIARVIREADPDLVALQEVDLYTGRSGKRDLAGELGLLTRMQPLFGRAMTYDGGEYGEAILSRYSFLSSRNHALPAQQGKEPRSALEVRVQLPGGDTIGFVGTHFDHTGDSDRMLQASRVNELFLEEDGPTLLAGDLNAIPGSPAMEILLRQWTAVSEDMAPTYPSQVNWDHALADPSMSGPSMKIDYILYRPACCWKVLETRVICDPEASDHCALLSVLELLPGRD